MDDIMDDKRNDFSEIPIEKLFMSIWLTDAVLSNLSRWVKVDFFFWISLHIV